MRPRLTLPLGGMLIVVGVGLALHTSPVQYSVSFVTSTTSFDPSGHRPTGVAPTFTAEPDAEARASGLDLAPVHDHVDAGVALSGAGLLVLAAGAQARRRGPGPHCE